MPAIQSHIHSDPGDLFNFDLQQQLHRMNVRPDVLRQGGMPQPPSQMLALNNQPFIQNQSQLGQQQPPNHMVLPTNANNANPSMSMLGGGPPNPNNSMVTPAQRYQMQLQQAGSQHRAQMLLRQSQASQPLNPSGGPAPNSHIGGLGHNQLQGIGFPNNMIQQSGNNVPVRRVASQPQLNPGAGHIGGMPQGVSSMSMGMNPQTSMPAQLRQVAQQAQQQQLRIQNQISPEMAIAMNRQAGNPGIPQNVARTGSAQAQLMNSLSQPPSLTQAQHPGGMQPSHHQNNFQTSVPLPPQHPQPQMSASPRSGSHSQSHTPSMSIAAPGPSQASVNRSRVSPENPMSFMNFQNPQFPQVPHNPARIPSNNGQFPFVPSSTPPNQMGDISQSMPTGLGNTPGGPGNRAGFHPTPAQQFAEMQQNNEGYSAHFSMPPPNVPPRPPSHNNHHPPLPQQQQQPQLRHSPHQSDHMNSHISHPQRPQSQPQVQPGRPASQPGHSHTPRTSQSQLPANPGLLPAGRIPPPQNGGPPQPGHQPQPSGSGQPLPIAPRPPPQPSTASASSTASSSQPSSDAPPGSVPVPRPQPNIVTLALGSGQGLIRLLQFSGILSSENKMKLQLSWWSDLVKEYFTPKAVMKFTLWKDNQRNEAKPFEIGVPILPRFFLVTTQSGVKSMTLSLDGARERMYAPGHAVVECVAAVWTYKYNNGYTVTLRGPLTAHVVMSSSHPPGSTAAIQSTGSQYLLKFDDFQFDANFHDKYIALESVVGSRVVESPKTPRSRNVPTPTASGSAAQHQQREEDRKWDEPRIIIEHASIPGEPVNAFGIPQATMRCLELAESVGQMADLITFSNETQLGPIDALSKFAAKIRETQPHNTAQASLINGVNSGIPSHPFASFPNPNGVAATPAVTLYSSAPPSAINPQPAPHINSPQNAPPSADNSPQKQHKAILQQSQGTAPTSIPAPASTPATAAASSGPNTNTPLLSNASLKRKQASDATSPTTTNAEQQPPTKRVTRKRGRTAGGG